MGEPRHLTPEPLPTMALIEIVEQARATLRAHKGTGDRRLALHLMFAGAGLATGLTGAGEARARRLLDEFSDSFRRGYEIGAPAGRRLEG